MTWTLLLLPLALAGAPEGDAPRPAAPASPAEPAGIPGVEPAGPPVTDEVEANRLAHGIAQRLRCTVCQGLSVADSQADAARAVRNRVLELVRQGYAEEQVLDYFADRYGDWILLEPRREGINWFLWLGPLAVFLGGTLVIAGMAGRRGGHLAAPEPAPDEDDPYVQRILRELQEP